MFILNLLLKVRKKIPNSIIFYKNYNLEGAIYRELYLRYRTKKKLQNLYYFNKLSLVNFLIIRLISVFRFTQKKKIDELIITNSHLKFKKICRYISKKNKKKLGYVNDNNFKFKSNKYVFRIKKIFFLNKKNNYYDFCGVINKLEIYKNIINFYKPQKIHLIEGDSVTDSVISQICKKNGIKCYCYQHGIEFPFVDKKTSKFDIPNFFDDFIYVVGSEFEKKYIKKRYKIKHILALKNKIKISKSIKKNSKYRYNYLFLANKNFLNIKKNINIFKEYIKFFSIHEKVKILYVKFHPTEDEKKIKKIINSVNSTTVKFLDKNKDLFNENRAYYDFALCFYHSSIISELIKKNIFPIVFSNDKRFRFHFLKRKKIGIVKKRIIPIKNFKNTKIDKLFFNNSNIQNQKNFLKKIK